MGSGEEDHRCIATISLHIHDSVHAVDMTSPVDVDLDHLTEEMFVRSIRSKLPSPTFPLSTLCSLEKVTVHSPLYSEWNHSYSTEEETKTLVSKDHPADLKLDPKSCVSKSQVFSNHTHFLLSAAPPGLWVSFVGSRAPAHWILTSTREDGCGCIFICTWPGRKLRPQEWLTHLWQVWGCVWAACGLCCLTPWAPHFGPPLQKPQTTPKGQIISPPVFIWFVS